MKSILALFASIFALIPAAYAAPALVWLDTHHDFGAFQEQEGVATCSFRAVNVGNEPVVIINARANCGCTTPDYSEAPVLPGDTLSIIVGFDPAGRPGRFRKNITVTTNAEPAKTTLAISGTVIGSPATLARRYPVDAGSMKLRSDELFYGSVPVTATGGQYVEAYNATADTLRPAVAYAPPSVSVTISPAAIPPGENFVISTVFDPTRAGAWDAVTDSIVISANGVSTAIRTRAVVTEDFKNLTGRQLDAAPVISLPTNLLDLGRISRDSRPVTISMEIGNTGQSPLKIRRIYCPNPAVSVAFKKLEIKPGKKERLTVTVNPGQLPVDAKMINTAIYIIVNDPANPRNSVRLVGEVTPIP